MRWEDEDRRRAADEARWAVEAQRRVIEDQRWQSLEAYMNRSTQYAQGASSSTQYHTYDPTAGWNDQDDPSAPQ